jgi:hypothetical protein
VIIQDSLDDKFTTLIANTFLNTSPRHPYGTFRELCVNRVVIYDIKDSAWAWNRVQISDHYLWTRFYD